MSKKIGVLGCGWLGLPLAKSLVQKSHAVSGTTTSEEKLKLLKQAGIDPHLISFSASKIEGDIQLFLDGIDVLIINIPPKLRSGAKESYVDKMELLHAALKRSSVSKLLFVSSTSVYGEVTGEVTEKTKPQPKSLSGTQLLASENLFLSDKSLDTTIIRFGGLIGPNRHPVTMLSGRDNLANGQDPVNLIHLEDCIHMITTILEHGYWNEVFNGVYPEHPSKKEYYTKEATQRGITPPNYTEVSDRKAGKIVKSQNFLDKPHTFHTPISS